MVTVGTNQIVLPKAIASTANRIAMKNCCQQQDKSYRNEFCSQQQDKLYRKAQRTCQLMYCADVLKVADWTYLIVL